MRLRGINAFTVVRFAMTYAMVLGVWWVAFSRIGLEPLFVALVVALFVVASFLVAQQ